MFSNILDESGRSLRSLDSVAWSVGSGDLSVSRHMLWVEKEVCNRKTRVAMRQEELDVIV